MAGPFDGPLDWAPGATTTLDAFFAGTPFAAAVTSPLWPSLRSLVTRHAAGDTAAETAADHLPERESFAWRVLRGLRSKDELPAALAIIDGLTERTAKARRPLSWEQAAHTLAFDLTEPMAVALAKRAMPKGRGREVIEPDEDDIDAARVLVLRVAALRFDDGRPTMDRVYALASHLASAAADVAALRHLDIADPEVSHLVSTDHHRRQLRRLHRDITVHFGDVLGLIGAKRSPYVATTTRELLEHRHAATARWIETALAADDQGNSVPMQAILRAASAKRDATLRALLNGMDRLRRRRGKIAVFITLTIPGDWQPAPTFARRAGGTFDAHAGNHVARNDWMAAQFHEAFLARLKSHFGTHGGDLGGDYFGIWTAEGTKGGVLHRHVLIYIDREHLDALVRILTGAGWPTAETGAVKRTVHKQTKQVIPDSWDIGPHRADRENGAPAGAFAASIVNVRILQEKDGDAAMATIANYVMKYVAKTLGSEAVEGEAPRGETLWYQSQGRRRTSFLGLPKGLQALWQDVMTKDLSGFPADSLAARLHAAISERRDGDALELALTNANGWRDCRRALKRQHKAEIQGTRLRRKTLARIAGAIEAAPDSLLLPLRQARVGAKGSVYAKRWGTAEYTSDEAVAALRALVRKDSLDGFTPRIAGRAPGNWVVVSGSGLDDYTADLEKAEARATTGLLRASEARHDLARYAAALDRATVHRPIIEAILEDGDLDDATPEQRAEALEAVAANARRLRSARYGADATAHRAQRKILGHGKPLTVATNAALTLRAFGHAVSRDLWHEEEFARTAALTAANNRHADDVRAFDAALAENDPDLVGIAVPFVGTFSRGRAGSPAERRAPSPDCPF